MESASFKDESTSPWNLFFSIVKLFIWTLNWFSLQNESAKNCIYEGLKGTFFLKVGYFVQSHQTLSATIKVIEC